MMGQKYLFERKSEHKGESLDDAHQTNTIQGRYFSGDRETCINLCQKRDIKPFPVLDELNGVLNVCFILQHS